MPNSRTENLALTDRLMEQALERYFLILKLIKSSVEDVRL